MNIVFGHGTIYGSGIVIVVITVIAVLVSAESQFLGSTRFNNRLMRRYMF